MTGPGTAQHLATMSAQDVTRKKGKMIGNNAIYPLYGEVGLMDPASGSGHVGWSRMAVSVPTSLLPPTFPQTKQGAEVASVWTQLLIWEKNQKSHPTLPIYE